MTLIISNPITISDTNCIMNQLIIQLDSPVERGPRPEEVEPRVEARPAHGRRLVAAAPAHVHSHLWEVCIVSEVLQICCKSGHDNILTKPILMYRAAQHLESYIRLQSIWAVLLACLGSSLLQ